MYVPVSEFFDESNETGHYGVQSTCEEDEEVMEEEKEEHEEEEEEEKKKKKKKKKKWGTSYITRDVIKEQVG